MAAASPAPGASTLEALLSYAKQNEPLEIQRIVDKGVLDISSGDHTALHAACGSGNVEQELGHPRARPQLLRIQLTLHKYDAACQGMELHGIREENYNFNFNFNAR